MPHDGIAEQVTVRGQRATGPATLLIEVPHGADTAAHYDALAARLVGPLPARLDRFFHVNPDVQTSAATKKENAYEREFKMLKRQINRNPKKSDDEKASEIEELRRQLEIRREQGRRYK